MAPIAPYKMNIPQVSLEQWSMFIAVVEAGSFQAAADKLLKSQSSISYAMQKMQESYSQIWCTEYQAAS